MTALERVSGSSSVRSHASAQRRERPFAEAMVNSDGNGSVLSGSFRGDLPQAPSPVLLYEVLLPLTPW